MSDDPPVYEKFLSLIRDRTRDNNRLSHVLKVFEAEVDPAIRAMPQEQLAEAFSECLYGLCRELEINRSKQANIENFETEAGIFKAATGHLETRLEKAPAEERSRGAQKAGRTKKKKYGDAKKLWLKWAEAPSLFKNRAEFKREIVDLKYCDSLSTAQNWIGEFSKETPINSAN